MPGSASAIRAGFAFVEIGGNDARLQRTLSRAQKRLQNFGSAVQRVGTRMFTFGLTMAAPIAYATRTFAGFEQKMADVRSLVDITDAQFKSLTEEAQRLGRTTVYTASQAAEAMYTFAQAGKSVDEILAATGPTLALAAAGSLEMGEAADYAVGIMNTFKMKASELPGAIDVMAKAMSSSKMSLLELNDAMKYVGPLANDAKIGFHEIAAAIGMLSNANISGPMAGTTLRGIIASLTNPSAEALKMLEEHRIAIMDANKDLLPLTDIIYNFSKALEGMGSAERLMVLGKVFDNRQLSGMSRLIGLGSKRIEAFAKSLNESGGFASKVATTRLNTLTGSFLLLRSAAEAVQIAVGDALSGPLRAAMAVAIDATSRFSLWVGANQDVVAIVAASAAAVMAAGGAFIALAVAIKTVAFAFGGFVFAAHAVLGVLGFALSPVGVLTAAIGLLVAKTVDWGKVVETVADGVGVRFARLRDSVGETLAAIRDAIAAGDIGLAANVLFRSLEVIWLEGTMKLRNIWYDLVKDMRVAFLTAQYAMLETWAKAEYQTKRIAHEWEYGQERARIETSYEFAKAAVVYDPDGKLIDAAADVAKAGVSGHGLRNAQARYADVKARLDQEYQAKRDYIEETKNNELAELAKEYFGDIDGTIANLRRERDRDIQAAETQFDNQRQPLEAQRAEQDKAAREGYVKAVGALQEAYIEVARKVVAKATEKADAAFDEYTSAAAAAKTNRNADTANAAIEAKGRFDVAVGELTAAIRHLEAVTVAANAAIEKARGESPDMTAVDSARQRAQEAAKAAARAAADVAAVSAKMAADKEQALNERQRKFNDAVSASMRTIESRTTVVGTFNSAALQGIGYSGDGERIARATEATAKWTRWLADDARHNKAVFT